MEVETKSMNRACSLERTELTSLLVFSTLAQREHKKGPVLYYGLTKKHLVFPNKLSKRLGLLTTQPTMVHVAQCPRS